MRLHYFNNLVMFCLLFLSACSSQVASENSGLEGPASLPTATDEPPPTAPPTIPPPTATITPTITATPTPNTTETPAFSEARDWTGSLTAVITSTIDGEEIQIGVRSTINVEFSFHVMRRTIEGSGVAYYYPNHVCLSGDCQVTGIACSRPPDLDLEGQTNAEYFPYEVTANGEHTPETFLIHLVPIDFMMFAFPVLCTLDLQEGARQSTMGDPGTMISAMHLAYQKLELPRQANVVVEKSGTEPFLGGNEEETILVDYWYSVVIQPVD